MKRPAVIIGIIGALVALLLAALSVYFYGPSTSAPILLFISAILGAFLTWIATTFKDEPPKAAEAPESDVPAPKPSGCYNSEHCYFPQQHFERGLSRGDEIVDVFLGREDQRGKEFELIPALVQPEAQKALRDGAFAGMPELPAGVVMFASTQVRRKAN